MVRAPVLGASVPGTRWALVTHSFLTESCLEGFLVFCFVLFSGREIQKAWGRQGDGPRVVRDMGLGQSETWAWGSQGHGPGAVRDLGLGRSGTWAGRICFL